MRRRFANNVRLERRFEYRRERGTVQINEQGAHALDVVLLAAFAVRFGDSDEDARASFLQCFELVDRTFEIAMNDTREAAPLLGRIIESLKRGELGLPIEPLEE